MLLFAGVWQVTTLHSSLACAPSSRKMNGILFVALKVATTLSSIGIYLSPVPSMRRILKNKSPGQMQLIPLVVLFVNCYQK